MNEVPYIDPVKQLASAHGLVAIVAAIEDLNRHIESGLSFWESQDARDQRRELVDKLIELAPAPNQQICGNEK